MLSQMSSTEFTEWIAFASLEPFGADVDDFRAGIGAAVNLNMNRKEGARAVSPYDLMPWREVAEPVPLTPEQISANIVGTLASIAKKEGA